MQVTLRSPSLSPSEASEAEAALRQCVHCGMCNATCPTFQLSGDELEGPRGRIYLIKNALEGQAPALSTLQHLDSCLTCRSCETTCPSQVPYARLAEIGRRSIAATLSIQGFERPLSARALRWMLREGLTRPALFAAALGLGRALAAFLPASLRAKVPALRPAGVRRTELQPRRIVLLEGCVQPALDPRINAATSRVLATLGIQCQVAPRVACCGAVRYHLDDVEGGLHSVRQNVDAWIPLLDAGADAIVTTASGCGQMVKDYGHLLRDDPGYAERARRVSAHARDLSEVLIEHQNTLLERMPMVQAPRPKAVFHPPCTLQHGQGIRGSVEKLLAAVGVELIPFADSHLCCGSAGTYSVLQPEIAGQLRARKLAQLEARSPELILTANIGCQTHLQAGTPVPVRHWIEMVDDRLAMR